MTATESLALTNTPDETSPRQTTTIGALGWGAYLPTRVVDNTEVGALAGVDAEWIAQKTGIMSRHRAAESEASSDLALHAGRQALHRAGIDPGDLSVIVLATSTPDQPQPPTATMVQHSLGATNAAAFDLNAVCSGFVFALGVARDMTAASGGYALVIGVDVYSRILDPTDRRTAVLFGDGAGAVVIGPSSGRSSIRAIQLLTSGTDQDLIKVVAGGSRIPATVDSVRDGSHWFTMNGRGVKEYVAAHVPDALGAFLAEHRVDPSSIDHLVTHQANGRMIEELYPRLGLLNATVHQTVHRYGNTGSASIPVTLAEAAPHIQLGASVLLATFGGGMAMGFALMDW